MTNFKHGSVKISNEIIDQLVAESALNVDGVESVLGYKGHKLETLTKKPGVVTNIEDNKMEVAITIVLDSNHNIYQVSENVQKAIKEQINTMLGLDVTLVNVFVE